MGSSIPVRQHQRKVLRRMRKGFSELGSQAARSHPQASLGVGEAEMSVQPPGKRKRSCADYSKS